MQSLTDLLAADASLLPLLNQLAEQRAAASGAGARAGAGLDVHARQPARQQAAEGEPSTAQPSLLVQLLQSLEQPAVPAAGVDARPSWIPSGLFQVRHFVCTLSTP